MVPRSGCGSPRLGGAGSSQNLCCQLCCRSVLRLPLRSAHLRPCSEMRCSVHPTQGLRCCGDGAVCCLQSWQGRAAQHPSPVTLGGQHPCPGDGWLLPWQSCQAEGSGAGLRARGLGVTASGPDSSPPVGVPVPGTGTLRCSTWGAGTAAKEPVSRCNPGWCELGRAELSAQDSRSVPTLAQPTQVHIPDLRSRRCLTPVLEDNHNFCPGARVQDTAPGPSSAISRPAAPLAVPVPVLRGGAAAPMLFLSL